MTDLLDMLDDLSDGEHDTKGCIAFTQRGDGKILAHGWADFEAGLIGITARGLAHLLRGRVGEVMPLDALDLPAMGEA